MGYIVRMPKLGVEMQTGVLLEWHVDPGEAVSEADLLAEIESEKTVAEVTAREAGSVEHVLLEEGAEVEPGTAMAIVSEGDDVDDLLAEVESEGGSVDESDAESESAAADESREEPTPTAASSQPVDEPTGESVRATPKARARAAEADVDLTTVRGTGPKGSVTEADVGRALEGDEPRETTAPSAAPAGPSGATTTDELLVTPRARKRATELEVPLETVSGTGPHGSIREADVETAAQRGSTPAATAADAEASSTQTPAPPADGRTVVDERPLTGMRATISRRLSESWEAPHVTVDRRVDVEAALEAAERAGDVVSVTDVLFKGVSETLAEHPSFNATFEDDVHRTYAEHNIGFAVDVDAGLVTPVLRGVERMSLTELAHNRGALTERVLDNRHDVGDLQGGTFTISNLGVLGIDSFTPIINPPQVAILGVNRIREDPVRTDRGLAFRRTMGFSLSFDHRVIDGADAARFLGTLAEHLQEPESILEGVE